MDPATINECFNSAISGASEGTASLAILGALAGGKFLWRKIRDHPESVQEIAVERVIDLSERTSLRINALEQKIGSIETQVEAKLSDPDFIFLFHNACIAAARTDGQEYHELLARLISDRITAESDSLRALAAHMACNAIPQLSPTHLRFLGVMAAIHTMRPPDALMEILPEMRVETCIHWLLDEITPMMPIGGMNEYDYTHLVAISCVTFEPYVSAMSPREYSLLWVISKKFSINPQLNKWDPIIKHEVGFQLVQHWTKTDMHKLSLTSAGALIGMHVRDAIPKREAEWDF